MTDRPQSRSVRWSRDHIAAVEEAAAPSTTNGAATTVSDLRLFGNLQSVIDLDA